MSSQEILKAIDELKEYCLKDEAKRSEIIKRLEIIKRECNSQLLFD